MLSPGRSGFLDRSFLGPGKFFNYPGFLKQDRSFLGTGVFYLIL